MQKVILDLNQTGLILTDLGHSELEEGLGRLTGSRTKVKVLGTENGVLEPSFEALGGGA